MRMPRVPFTVRRMMVVVAVVAALIVLGIQAANFRRASERYRVKAVMYERGEIFCRSVRVTNVRENNLWRGRYEWCAAMKAKYERLARSPWLPVEPDPPDPG